MVIDNSSNDNNSEFSNESLPARIAKYILKRIIEGKLLPGDKIIEENIAKELDTSRAPVREALYLLQVDHVVERIPRRGVIVKSFTATEIKEYTMVMIGLIQMAIELSSEKWTAENLENIESKLEVMSTMYNAEDLIGYQQKSTLLTSFLFHVADNKALLKFYNESVYILNVFANVKWTMQTMQLFHPKMCALVQSIKEKKFDEAKALIPDLLLETLE